MKSAHADLAGGGRGGAAAQHIAHAQQQLARIEGLGEIVVDAGLQTFDALLGLGAGGQHQDGHLALGAQRAGEVDARLLRHHHVENEKVEGEAAHGGARRGGIDGGGDAEAVVVEIAGEQVADTAVVVHDEDMRRVVVRDRWRDGP